MRSLAARNKKIRSSDSARAPFAGVPFFIGTGEINVRDPLLLRKWESRITAVSDGGHAYLKAEPMGKEPNLIVLPIPV